MHDEPDDLAARLAMELKNAGEAGCTLAELERALDRSRRERAELKALLEALAERGAVHRGRGARWYAEPDTDAAPPAAPTGRAAPAAARYPTGRLRRFPSGRGEVLLEDGGPPVRIRLEDHGAALDGDTVRLDVWDERGSRCGRVIGIEAHSRRRVAGIVASGPDGPRLEADDPRLPGRILLTDLAGAAEGESVVAEITVYPVRPGDPLQARVTHRLGSPLDPRNEVAKILIVEEVRDEYGAEALAQAESAPADPGPADLADRADLRDVPFITIDPGDARDFDDAVAVADAADGGWRLDVAVADVSHYVRPGSPIDVEASLRTLSLYLPNRAIHMLPARLSSGICSLAPDRDRLAVVVRLGVSAEGQITDEEVVLAVIRSQARLDYEGVAAVMSGGHDHTGPGDAWVETLTRLTAMASALHRARIARGGLDFDLPEAKVVLDEDDPLAVRDVCQAKPTEAVRQAYRLIEECMVAANESVGRFCAARRLPVIWRVHDAPSGDRFTAFVDLANAVGVPLRRRAKPTPITIQNVLTKLAGHRVAGPLQTALLRCLAQAVYGAANIGHFALAAPAYLHFTSPIRRYPDLLTHRAVKHALTGHGDRGPLRSEVAAIALRCTEAERHSVSVERAVVDLYRAFVMREHLGETFAGVITSVAAFGMFVQIPAPFVEGLLPREALGFDRWDVTEDGASLRGQRTGRTYTVGDRLDVRVAEASIPRRQVAFALATPPEPEDPRAALLRRPAPTPPRWPRHQRGPGRRGR